MYMGTNCYSLILLIKNLLLQVFLLVILWIGSYQEMVFFTNGREFFSGWGRVCLGILGCDGRGNLVSDFRRKIGEK